MQPQDVVKLCYQAAFGAEHLLNDVDAAKRYLGKEYAEVCVRDIPLCEVLSDDVCRINLIWKSISFVCMAAECTPCLSYIEEMLQEGIFLE